MQTSTPKDFFENILPKRFNPDKASGIDVVVQVSITGNNGGEWIVTIKDQKLSVDEGQHPSPNLVLKMAEKDYLDLVNGKISAEKAFFSGKIQFKGSLPLALKLRQAGFL